ncbi:MAG TPA: hypothetical protein EYP29_05905 [Thermoplasmata archaeon]|nr:hypothetical protein [Thermoplasmata archaeon]
MMNPIAEKDSVQEKYLKYLDEISNLKSKFGKEKKKGKLTVKEKMKRLEVCTYYLNTLCDGWRGIRIFHVTGTSGKGTTALFLSHMLAKRYKVGTLLSPHIFDVRERVLFNLKPLRREEMVRFWEEELKPEIEKMVTKDESFILSLPEIMLLTAVDTFLKKSVDYAVLEAGLGGRYDQTNLFQPVASLITNVSLDHTHILGKSLREIAFEKGGIIKPHVPFYTSERKGSVVEIFRKICEERGTTFHQVSPSALPFNLKLPAEIDTDYNRMNASLASFPLFQMFSFSEKEINCALASVRLPARFEMRGKTLIDIAHNEEEIHALTKAIEKRFPKKKKIFVIGMADKKRHRNMLQALVNSAKKKKIEAIFFSSSPYRGVSQFHLLEIARTIPFLRETKMKTFSSPIEAYKEALKIVKESKEKMVVVTGSTFFIDAIFNPSNEIKKINMG